MTKKHFKAIAAILATHRTDMPESTFTELTRDLAEAFARDNSRFDSIRFIKACRGEPIGRVHGDAPVHGNAQVSGAERIRISK